MNGWDVLIIHDGVEYRFRKSEPLETVCRLLDLSVVQNEKGFIYNLRNMDSDIHIGMLGNYFNITDDFMECEESIERNSNVRRRLFV